MAGSFKKGAIPPDPRVVIPKLEDYIDVSSLAGGLPAAPGIIDRESKVKAWPMYANGPDPAAPPAIASTGVGDCTCAGTSINAQSLQQLIMTAKTSGDNRPRHCHPGARGNSGGHLSPPDNPGGCLRYFDDLAVRRHYP